MRNILYVNKKETIELSYPDWIAVIMNIIWRHLKVKTVKIINGTKIKTIRFGEHSPTP